MRIRLGILVLVTMFLVLQAASEDQGNAIPGDTLKQLSLDGEKLVEEEVKIALYGVKDIEEVMWSNQLKHQHLMKSLRRSSQKKEEAAKLAQEVTKKLLKAEEQCRDSLQSEWEQCRPCLEEACKTFYTSFCRRGFASFRAKAASFFHSVSRRSTPGEPSAEAGDIVVNQDPGSQADTDEVARVEASFSGLMRRVGGLVDRSRTLVGETRSRLDKALRGAFSFNRAPEPYGAPYGSGALEPFGAPEPYGALEPDTDEAGSVDLSAPGPFDPARDSGFLQGVGLEEVLGSFFDFGRSVVEEFGAVVGARSVVPEDVQEVPEGEGKRGRGLIHNRQLCRDLRRHTSECWQLQDQCDACQGPLLKECPSVRELHVALEEASQLMEACRQQYDEILSVVRRHTDQTLGLLGDMAAEYGWVAPVGNGTTGGQQPRAFSITTALPKSQGGAENATATETEVQVTILNSPPLFFLVPGELRIQDLGFLQYVTREALDLYKRMVRAEEE